MNVHAKDWRISLRVESSRPDTELLLHLPKWRPGLLGRTNQASERYNPSRRYIYKADGRFIASLLGTDAFEVEAGTETNHKSLPSKRNHSTATTPMSS